MTETTNFLEDNFQTGEKDVTAMCAERSLMDGDASESIWWAGDSPPDSFVVDSDHVRETSIITVIRSHMERDPEFAALVARNDRDANSIPGDNPGRTYDELLDSPACG